MSTAKVIHIFTAPQAGAPMQNHQQIKATEGIGLEGDRYAANKGKWSEPEPQAKRQVTLIERENIDALLNKHGIEVDPALLRRNIVTQGVNLNDLVGITFQIGDVRPAGRRALRPLFLYGIVQQARGAQRVGQQRWVASPDITGWKNPH